MCTYLDSCVLDGLIWIGHIFQSDAVELSFVDVCDAIVFASLWWTDWTLQMVAEADIAEAASEREKQEKN